MKEAGGVDSPGAWNEDSMRHACGWHRWTWVVQASIGHDSLHRKMWYGGDARVIQVHGSKWFVAMNGVWCQGCKMVVRPRLG